MSSTIKPKTSKHERDKTQGKARSPQWPKVRKEFLKGKVCAICGGTKKLEAHHIKSFHLHPDLELDPKNLIPLCEGNKDINCHLVGGHVFSFQFENPHVVELAKLISEQRAKEKARVTKAKSA